MRCLLLAVGLLGFTADRAADRAALLSADRALSDRTAQLGLMRGFAPALVDSAAYLHPGAPVIRGAGKIRSFVAAIPPDSAGPLSWSPAFADVSADGRLGYTYGWTRSGAARGKYLACWQKEGDAWRVAAYARTRLSAATDSIVPPRPVPPAPQIRGRADPGELLRADSAFAALSVAQGAKQAFVAYATGDAVVLGAGPQFNEGQEAIGAAFDNFPSGAVLDWWPLAAVIAESGDLGCTVGEAIIARLNQYSKYLTIWRRQQDGSWKFVADGGNGRPAAPR